MLVAATVHAADIQDRDGAVPLLGLDPPPSFPWLRHVFADGGYRRGRASKRRLAALGNWTLGIVKRSGTVGPRGSSMLPSKRWVVERTLAWLDPQIGDLAKDFEALYRNRRRLALS